MDIPQYFLSYLFYFISSTGFLATYLLIIFLVVLWLTVCIILITALYLTIFILLVYLESILFIPFILHTLNFKISPFSLSFITFNANFSFPTSCSCVPFPASHIKKVITLQHCNSNCSPLPYFNFIFSFYVCYKSNYNKYVWT